MVADIAIARIMMVRARYRVPRAVQSAGATGNHDTVGSVTRVPAPPPLLRTASNSL